jgi:hypothetical protein
MSPLEAAVLVPSLDLRNLLRFAGQLKRQGVELKRQGQMLESFARLQPAAMESVKTAIRCIRQDALRRASADGLIPGSRSDAANGNELSVCTTSDAAIRCPRGLTSEIVARFPPAPYPGPFGRGLP